MDKATFLAKLQRNRALFDRTLALVDEPNMLYPHVPDSWSGKDLLAHLTAWDQQMVHVLSDIAGGKTPTLQPIDADAFNAETVAASRSRPLQVIVANSRRTFQTLLEYIHEIPEEDLTNPERFTWLHGKALWQHIAVGPAYGHYQEHFVDLLHRIDRAKWFKADTNLLRRYTGTYTNADIGTLILRHTRSHLMISRGWDGQELECYAVDAHHFAYLSGLITFDSDQHERVQSLEIRSYIFQRVAES